MIQVERGALLGFGEALLFSYAQILFSHRRWFGGVLLAVSFFDPIIGLFGLCGGAICNASALLLKFDSSRVRSGFYGFNGILFGAVYGYFFEPTAVAVLLFPLFAFVTFLISAMLEHYMASAFDLPGLSLPFMLATYVALVFLRNVGHAIFRGGHSTSFAAISGFPPIETYCRSMSLVLVQSNPWAGVLIAAALLVFSRTSFVLSVLSFAVQYLFVQALNPALAESMGVIFGLNAILTGIALGGALVIPSPKSALLAIAGSLIVAIMTSVLISFSRASELPLLVLPFNFVVMATIYSLKFRAKSSGLTLLYFAPGSPEENLYYHSTAQSRLEKIKWFMADLPFVGKWSVSQGESGAITHRGDWQHAWDFVVTDDSSKTYSDDGARLEDYYCCRLPITSPLDGVVVSVTDHLANNPIGDVNLERNWGNVVVIRHGEQFHSSLAHLEPGSVCARVGQTVRKGEIVALCGNSGRSPEPHLHFQFQKSESVGDKTLAYPFGYYIEHVGDGTRLKLSDSPAEGTQVENLILHRTLQSAFTFKLGQTREFEISSPDGTRREQWEVMVDVFNTLYIESSAGSWASIVVLDKVFQITGFRGNRRSALYFFYLTAAQMPLGFHAGLRWSTELPLDKVDRSAERYLLEFALLSGLRRRVFADYRFGSQQNAGGIVVHSAVTTGIMGGTSRRSSGTGELHITNLGAIAEFSYKDSTGRTTVCRRCLSEME